MGKIIAFFVLIFIQISANTCGENCPSNTCPECPCGSVRDYVNVTYWCSKYSWNQSCCECIVSHESSGNKNAMNYNTDSSYDVGLWQINSFNWPYCGNFRTPCELDENFECAIQVYKWGRNTWVFWTTASKCGCENSP